MAELLDFADLDELAGLLAAVDGIRSADSDPAKVTTPGVWIRWDAVSFDLLGGATHRLTLHLVIADTPDPARVRRQLAALFNAAAPLLHRLGGPAGDLTMVGLALPGSSAPLPALAVPIELITHNPA